MNTAVMGGTLGCFPENTEMARRDRTGWLGRQVSNLGMAESKSDKFFNFVNEHSESIMKFAPLTINGLARDSEYAEAILMKKQRLTSR